MERFRSLVVAGRIDILEEECNGQPCHFRKLSRTVTNGQARKAFGNLIAEHLRGCLYPCLSGIKCFESCENLDVVIDREFKYYDWVL